MGAGDRDLIGIEAIASEGHDNLMRNEAIVGLAGLSVTKPMAEEDQPAGAGNQRNEASALEGGEILKRKKDAMLTKGLWKLRRADIHVSGVMDVEALWLQKKAEAEETQRAGAGKMRKRVVKRRVPPAGIKYLKETPYKTVEDFTDEEVANLTKNQLKLYALRKFIDSKEQQYDQALIHQYDAMGHADDESEVSDDEDMIEN